MAGELGLLGLALDDWLAVIETVAVVVQALAIVLGGGWALYTYLTTRQGEAVVSIAARTRVARARRRALLFVQLTLTNSSLVVFHVKRARATLMDASGHDAEGRPVLVPFAEQDPLLPVYGEQVEDPAAIEMGELFRYYEGQQVSLEPSESVDTEVVFPLRAAAAPRLGMRVEVQGWQRKREGEPYIWSSFFFVVVPPEGQEEWRDATIGTEKS